MDKTKLPDANTHLAEVHFCYLNVGEKIIREGGANGITFTEVNKAFVELLKLHL